MNCILKNVRASKYREEFYETLVSSTRLLHNQLGIFPTQNMISNIGNEGESTHGTSSLKLLPKATQKVFNIPRYEIKRFFETSRKSGTFGQIYYEKELDDSIHIQLCISLDRM